MEIAALLLAQQQVAYSHGFLVGHLGCENLNLALLSQTGESNTAFSHRQTASWNSQRHSPVRIQEGGNNQNS